MRRRRRSACAGYTLLELLVVVAILALVLGLSIPRLTRGPADALRLQVAAHDLLDALRLTRAAAIFRGVETRLLIDVDRHTFEAPDIVSRPYGADIATRLNVAEPERVTASRGGFRFFPDGSSTGGDIVLALNRKETKLCVNWLNGAARQGRGC